MYKMKKLLIIATAFFTAILSLNGCSKSELEQQTNKDEYYVKYLFEGTNNVGINFYCNCNISFTSEKGKVEMTFNAVNHLSYEVITGPFKRNSKVYATLDGDRFPNTSIQIFVSKNNSPFALKDMTNEGMLKYTINY